MMSDYNLILIMIAAAAIFILTAIYIWQVFFWRSWGRVINLLMGIFVAGDSIVDVNKKIEPDLSESRSDIMKAKAQTFENVPIDADDFVPQQAKISEEEENSFQNTTSDSGWPRALSEEERRDPRPFRHVHIGTENEEIDDDSDEDDD